MAYCTSSIFVNPLTEPVRLQPPSNRSVRAYRARGMQRGRVTTVPSNSSLVLDGPLAHLVRGEMVQ